MTPPAEVVAETVRAADGATTRIQYYPKSDDPSAPVLICMPAMGTPASKYTPLAEALFQAGFQVTVGELRGQVTSSVTVQRGVRYGYHECVTYDYPALFHAVEAVFPSAPRYLLGHSLGGQLGMLYLASEPGMATGAILVGAPSCHYRSWAFPMNLGVLAGVHLAVAIGSLFGFYPGRRIGLLGNQSTQIMRDLAAQTRTGLYQVPSSDVDFEPLLSKLNLPILAVTIEGDQLAPPGGIRKLCGKLEKAQVTHWTLVPPDSTRRNPHYGWIRDNASLVERVRSWLLQN